MKKRQSSKISDIFRSSDIALNSWKFYAYFFCTLFLTLIFVFHFTPNSNSGTSLRIESDAKLFQMFYDSGSGFSQNESLFSDTVFFLPEKRINRIRIDPYPNNKDSDLVQIQRIEITQKNGNKNLFKGPLLKDFLTPHYHISDIVYDDDLQTARITINGNDPQILLNFGEEELNKLTQPAFLLGKLKLIHVLLIFFCSILFLFLWIIRNKICSGLKKLNNFIDGSDIEDNENGSFKIRRGWAISPSNLPYNEKTYWILLGIVSLFFMVTYSGANINLLTWANYDDLLYFKQATNIINFKWLGSYNSLTLAKEPGYAIFLAFCMASGIPYLILISLCHIFAVFFFLTRSIWVFQKRKVLWFLMGVLLIFNPFFASELRIYRNQLAAISFLIFLGVIISLFNPNTKKETGFAKVIQGAIAFLGFGFLFFTRDESILYYGIIFVSVVLFLFIKRKIKSKYRNLYLLFAGFSGFLFFYIAISSINYFYYGRFITCERKSAPFTTAIQAFHSVEDAYLNPMYPKLSASQEKIERIAREVPVFREVAEIMLDPHPAFINASTYLDRSDFQFKKIAESDMPTSHFEWFWTQSINASGYYSDAQKAASFHKELETQINQALQNGDLNKREETISVGPYFLSKNDILFIIKYLPSNYFSLLPDPKKFMNRYRNFTVKTVPSRNDDKALTEWQEKLHVNYLHPDEPAHIHQSVNSLTNSFWNLWIVFFAYIILPILHVSIPLSVIAAVFTIIKGQWFYVFGWLVVFISFTLNYLLLSTIDVIVGFKATVTPYFLASYAAIVVNAFLTMNTIVDLLHNRLRKNRMN